MFSDRHHFSTFSKQNIIVWLSLAFQAGAINAGGLLVFKRFVTHVTGFATLVGYEIAHKDFYAALGMALVPIFFLLGVMIAGFLVDIRKQNHHQAHYSYAFFLTSFFLYLVYQIGLNETQGDIYKQLEPFNQYLLLALICLVSGIQNATVTTAYGSIIRTTHLTGPTTDLGIGLMRILTRTHVVKPRNEEIRDALMRAGVIGFFILGSIVSAFLFLHFGYDGFLLPLGISVILWMNSVHVINQFKKIRRKH